MVHPPSLAHLLSVASTLRDLESIRA